MILDGSNENDFIYTYREITLIVEKGLLERIKPVRIDYIQSDARTGFSITANMCNTGGGC